MTTTAQTTDTFTKADGTRVIAGQPVHEAVWERFESVGTENERLRRLLAELVDDSDCRFDHHGGCQEHGFLWLEQGEMCPNHEARELLASIPKEAT